LFFDTQPPRFSAAREGKNNITVYPQTKSGKTKTARLVQPGFLVLPAHSIRHKRRYVKYLYNLIYYFVKQKYIFYWKEALREVEVSEYTIFPPPGLVPGKQPSSINTLDDPAVRVHVVG
jgi:hypothetical protein